MGSVESAKMIAETGTGVFHRFLRLARLVARIALGALFVFSGAAKVYDPGEFATEVQKYNLLPWVPGVILALYLPWLEILCGLLLALKKFERGALLVIIGLLIIFTVALASAMFRGLDIDCGCFGKVFTSTGTMIPMVRNLLLLLVAGFLWQNDR
jgi:putative oxidoreductase